MLLICSAKSVFAALLRRLGRWCQDVAMAKKSWNDLSPAQRKAVIIGGVVEAALTGWMLRDLKRRDADQVRGPKLMWRAASMIQPFGPVGYVVLGRRKPA